MGRAGFEPATLGSKVSNDWPRARSSDELKVAAPHVDRLRSELQPAATRRAMPVLQGVPPGSLCDDALGKR